MWKIWSILIYLILSFFDTVICIIYVESGQSVTLNPNIKETPEEILWTHNGNKVAGVDDDITTFEDYGQFKGRAQINISTGQLTVHQMTSDDNGVYKSEIQINRLQHYSTHEIKVIDPVSEPKVTCELNSKSESRTLFCSVTSESVTAYEWTGPNARQHSGQELHISQEEDSNSVYICTVKNEVSHKSTSFTLQDCNTELDLKIILAVTIPIIVIIIVIIACIIYCVQRRNRDKKLKGTGRSGDNSARWNGVKSDGEDRVLLQEMSGSTQRQSTDTGADRMNKDNLSLHLVNSECSNEKNRSDLHEQDLNQSEQGNESVENAEQEKSEDKTSHKSKDRDEEAERMSRESDSDKNSRCADAGNIQKNPTDNDSQSQSDQTPESAMESNQKTIDYSEDEDDDEEGNTEHRDESLDKDSDLDYKMGESDDY